MGFDIFIYIVFGLIFLFYAYVSEYDGGDAFIAFFRRQYFIFLSKRNGFLDKKGSRYLLTNNKISFVYDRKNKFFACYDRIISERSIKVFFDKQLEYRYELNNHIMEQTFNIILHDFDNELGYATVSELLKDVYSTVEEENPLPKNIPNKNDNNLHINPKEKTDINAASAEEIAKLPGINFILAKRIVQHRELNGNFNSRAEFYSLFNIKHHFQSQIDELTIFPDDTSDWFEQDEDVPDTGRLRIKTQDEENENNDNNDKNNNNDRIVDF